MSYIENVFLFKTELPRCCLYRIIDTNITLRFTLNIFQPLRFIWNDFVSHYGSGIVMPWQH